MHQIRQGRQRVIDVRAWLGAVDLVKVDVVGAEPAQAGLALGDYPAAGVALPVGAVTHPSVELGRQYHLLSPGGPDRGQELADYLFRLARGVDVGGVYEVDAFVEGAPHYRDALLVVGVAPRPEHHRAQAERAHLHSGPSQVAVVHGGEASAMVAAMEPFGYWSARAVASAIRSKQVSPLEVLEACFVRADEVEPKLCALVWRNDDDARAAAKAAGEAVVHGPPEDLPPFHGVPMPVKDLTPVAGWPITYGSRAAPPGVSGESELVVEALERAGFLLTGRTNVPELGPLPVSENLRYGLTRNPWDLDKTAGGSSGGAAAVVAAGVFPAAHGNDGGGSLRIPASCCGLVGLKASRGRVPARTLSWEGAVVHGALTRDVADSAAILDVISGPDLAMWYNAPAPERPFLSEVGAGPGRLRVGLVLEAPFGLPVSPACVEAASLAGRALETLGHVVEPASLETPDEFVAAFLDVAGADFGDLDGVIDWDKAEPHIKAARAAAAAVDSMRYARSVHILQRYTRQMVRAWGRDFDLMLTPTMIVEPPSAGSVLAAVHAGAAVDAGGRAGDPVLEVIQMIVMTAGINATGQPAVSLPTHVSPGGVPVGVQLVGAPFSEALLVRVAAQLEEALPWSERRPPLSGARTVP